MVISSDGFLTGPMYFKIFSVEDAICLQTQLPKYLNLEFSVTKTTKKTLKFNQ